MHAVRAGVPRQFLTVINVIHPENRISGFQYSVALASFKILRQEGKGHELGGLVLLCSSDLELRCLGVQVAAARSEMTDLWERKDTSEPFPLSLTETGHSRMRERHFFATSGDGEERDAVADSRGQVRAC